MTVATGRPTLLLRLRAAGTVATGSLRLYWAGALLAVVLGIVGLSVQAPIRSLGQARQQSEPLLQLPPIPAAAGIAGSAASVEPAALQTGAVRQLYQLLLILGWGALIIAGISMLTRFTAQAAGRGPEIGVRRAAGATRRDLVLSLLGEGTILLLVILAVGLPAAALLLRRSVAAWPGTVPGAGLLPWVATLCTGAVVTLGVLAPLRYSGARFMRSQADGQVMLAVPAFQLAMSLAILMGSAALLRRGAPAPATAAAGSTAPTVLMALDASETSPEARARNITTLLERLGSAPGVAAVSLSSPGTLLGLGRVDDTTTDCGQCVRGGIWLRFDLHTARHHLVSPATFSAQGIRLISGRIFTAADRWGTERVAVVSRHLARSGFEARGAVGRHLFLGLDWPTRPYRVIGVVEDTRPAALGGALEPLDTIYLSVLQHPPTAAELLVTASDPGMTASTLVQLVENRVGAGWNARRAGTPEEAVAAAALPVRWFGRWFTLVGMVVLVGAVVGTFETMRMWVGSVSAEIAARRAVGASRSDILGWVLFHTLGTGVKGVLVGLFLYYAVLRVSLTNLVGGIPAVDPVLIAGLAGFLLGAAMLGAAMPTLRFLRAPIAQLFD